MRKTERMAARLCRPVDEEPASPAESGITVDYAAELADELGKKLGRKVRLVEKNGSGRIELAFYGTEDRERLIEQLRNL